MEIGPAEYLCDGIMPSLESFIQTSGRYKNEPGSENDKIYLVAILILLLLYQ